MSGISTVGILTADRPAVLRRALESLARQCEAYGHDPRFLVIDGSKQEANTIATRSTVSAFSVTFRRHADYVGTREAATVRAALGTSKAIASLLVPGAIGANRNLMLLLTAGEHILSVDDDIVCETWSLRDCDDRLALMGHRQEHLATGFFRSRAKVLAAVAQTPVDLIAAHDALLGRSLVDLVAGSPGPLDTTHACGHLRTAVRERQALVVRATFTGIAGDAATYCPYLLLFSTGRLRAQLWADRATFATALGSRETFRIARATAVTHDCGCMAPCMGLSNTSILPPFMPAGTNEDGVFGAMLAACDTKALFAHLPVGVFHDSGRPAARGNAGMRSATQSRVSEFLISLVLSRLGRDSPRSCEERLQAVARLLEQVGRMSDRECADLSRDLLLGQRLRELAFAEQALADCECPGYWRSAVKRYRDACLARMAEPAFFLPVEFQRGGSLDAGSRALRAFLRQFGRLIAAWPALWEAARAQNSRLAGANGATATARRADPGHWAGLLTSRSKH